MHMYGAALYWHMATSPGESMVTLDPDLLRNKKVLEIECMRGGGARYLAEVAGPECYVATDEREENIEICHAVHDVFPGLSYQQVKLSDIPSTFEKNSFDAMLCVEAGADLEKKEVRELLEELDDPEGSLKVEICTDIGRWIRATGLSPVNIPETHSVTGVAGCTYMRIVARKL